MATTLTNPYVVVVRPGPSDQTRPVRRHEGKSSVSRERNFS